MRIKTKISTQPITFSEATKKFLRVKKAAKARPRTLKDYEIVFNSFLKVSHNTLEFSVLCDDLLEFFSSIPDTSPPYIIGLIRAYTHYSIGVSLMISFHLTRL